ncbi:alcohol dehydrogenase catalytic domain-containing protein [Faunimonas sp. B44]|uniref:alcohol dehydrogenase catalytic domain-containing protein n=1 Tax=Faunimonas sp. B44 TaxID=3461493 RepID=UPI0040443B22
MATSPPEMMKAWICRRYGGPEVLSMEEPPKPVAGVDEVLIRIHATTVSSGDMRVRSLNLPRGLGLVGRLLFGLTRPRQPILGTELAGTVEGVGREVYSYKRGDDVIAFPGASMGCHAEFRVVTANGPIWRTR